MLAVSAVVTLVILFSGAYYFPPNRRGHSPMSFESTSSRCLIIAEVAQAHDGSLALRTHISTPQLVRARMP